MSNEWLSLVIVSLASYRVARMVCYERGAYDCFKLVREWVDAHVYVDWMRYGITCPLCVGFWFALLFALLPTWLVLPIAASGLQVQWQKLDWLVKNLNGKLTS